MTDPMLSQIPEAAVKEPRYTRKQVASILLSIGLIFQGASFAVNQDYKAAMVAWAGALGTAGLPSWWLRGWEIKFPDPEPLGKTK